MTGAGYLLDTNVISETRRLRPNPGVSAFLNTVNPARLFLSVLTMGELRKGVAAKRRMDEAAAAALGLWVDGIETGFADRLLPVDLATARHWGELAAERSVPVIDTLIAATAKLRGLTLVTRNIGDFAATGVDLLNPWAS